MVFFFLNQTIGKPRPPAVPPAGWFSPVLASQSVFWRSQYQRVEWSLGEGVDESQQSSKKILLTIAHLINETTKD
jgi:hypothetical protein